MSESETSELARLRDRVRELESSLDERSAELAESQRRYRRIFERTKDVIIVSTPDGRLIDINPSGLEHYGYASVEEMKTIDLRTSIWADPKDRDEFVDRMRKIGFVQHFEAQHRRRDGGVWDAIGTSAVVLGDDGEPRELLTILRDISEQKRLQRELEQMARTDSLTGLANRFVFRERLEAAVDAARHRGRRSPGFALLMLDVDRFKQINDSYGHPAGDAVLVEMARRLGSVVDEIDVLARIGGDEFALLTFDAATEEPVLATAERLVACGRRPIESRQRSIDATVSVGIAFPEDGDRGADPLMRRADKALYRAKGAGRDRFAR